MIWTIITVSVLMILSFLIGASVRAQKEGYDGFQLLAKEIDKLVQAQNGKIQRRGCGSCDYMATGEVLINVVNELRHHIMTRHPEVVNAASNPSRS